MLRHILNTLKKDQTGNILVVDDDQVFTAFVQNVLGEDHNVQVVHTGLHALEVLRSNFDLIFLDYRLPDLDGIHLLRSICLDARLAGVSVVIITEASDEELESQALALGAADFLRKPCSASTLKARAQLHVERRQSLKLLLDLALQDPLTKSLSRRAFFIEGNREFSRAKRHNKVFSLLYFDLDDFKFINDNYGHTIGDHVLREFAQICLTRKRSYDLFGRIGGDEFILLLPKTEYFEARQIAADLSKAFKDKSVCIGDKIELSIRASIGVAALEPFDSGLDEVIQRADISVYDAKKSKSVG